MKRIYYFLMLCAVLSSCTKEDELKPTGERDDYFSVPADATDAESKLRREFYSRTGVHALFNDTLRHELQGTYADGTPRWFTETVDFMYLLTSEGAGYLQFDYMDSQADKEKTLKFVEDYMIPLMDTGARPYSILLLKDLKYKKYSSGSFKSQNYYNSMRCLALNAGEIAEMDEAEYPVLCRKIMLQLVQDKLEKMIRKEKLRVKEFADFSDDYYYGHYYEFDKNFAKLYNTYMELQNAYYEADDLAYALESEYYDAQDLYDAGEMTDEEFAEIEKAYYAAQDAADEAYDEYQAVREDYKPACVEVAHRLGFITYSTYASAPYPYEDIKKYAEAVFDMTEEEFQEEYAGYTIMHEKYRVLKEIIIQLGFKF